MKVINHGNATLIVAIAIMMSGCIESAFPIQTGEGSIRGLNSAVTTATLAFVLEEQLIGATAYKDTTVVRVFHNLTYNASFDYQFFGDLRPTRLATVPFDLVKDHDYLFIFTGSLAAPAAMVWERPIRAWDGTETVFEVEFGHLSPQLAEVDIYFAAPGTVPVLGQARATLSNGNHSPVMEMPAGDYEVIVTSKDDPTDIIFQSSSITYGAASNVLVSIFDWDPSITAPISVRLIFGTGTNVELADINSPPTLRTLQATIGNGPVDLYRNLDFTAPLIANVAFSEVSAPVDTVSGISTYTFTDAGNSGAVLSEEDFTVVAGQRSTRILVGQPGTPLTMPTVDDFRSLEDSSKLRISQTSVNQTIVDIYLIVQGDDINDAVPRFFSLPLLSSTNYINVVDNTYDLYATIPFEKTIVGGPYTFSVVAGDVVHFALIDTVDPNVVEFLEYDHVGITP